MSWREVDQYTVDKLGIVGRDGDFEQGMIFSASGGADDLFVGVHESLVSLVILTKLIA